MQSDIEPWGSGRFVPGKLAILWNAADILQIGTMLSCSGKPKTQADIENKKINKQLRKEKKKYRSIHRLLLLGKYNI